MLTFLDTITGYIAPHECLACGHEGALLCDRCIQLLPDPVPRCYRCGRTDNGWKTCKTCRKQSPLEQVIVATMYEGFAEAVIRKLKFERAYAAHATIAAIMAPYVPVNTVLVPIPTATSRVRQRGYDQALLISNKLAQNTSSRSVIALDRYGQQRQTGSSRSNRLKQLSGAFQVHKDKLAKIESIILVDDVLTTGATLEAAAAIVKLAGVKHISAVAFARAE